jgi:hypothetical protein
MWEREQRRYWFRAYSKLACEKTVPKEMAGDVPSYPTRKVSNRSFAKLSAWYIMRGLLPTSPSTRIATDRGLGLLNDFLNDNSSHDTQQNTTMQINWGRVGPASRSRMRDVFND